MNCSEAVDAERWRVNKRARGTPRTIQDLLDQQRTLWRQPCPSCGHEPGVATREELALRARVRELEGRLRELEAKS